MHLSLVYIFIYLLTNTKSYRNILILNIYSYKKKIVVLEQLIMRCGVFAHLSCLYLGSSPFPTLE